MQQEHVHVHVHVRVLLVSQLFFWEVGRCVPRGYQARARLLNLGPFLADPVTAVTAVTAVMQQ